MTKNSLHYTVKQVYNNHTQSMCVFSTYDPFTTYIHIEQKLANFNYSHIHLEEYFVAFGFEALK